jgi:AraC-like DNA-binding protein
MMRSVGLDTSHLALQDQWIPVAAVVQLLEVSAAAAGTEDFGLRLSETRSLSNLGPVGLVAREEPDLRSALAMIARYERAHNEALRSQLSERNGLATIKKELDLGERMEARQAIELTVSVFHRVVQGFATTPWQPLSICFAHERRADPEVYRRAFGCKVVFGHAFNGIVFDATYLDMPNAMSDPLLRPYARRYLQSIATPWDRTQVDHVRELIETLLPTGRCSADQVARSLGVDRRTMHRHLSNASETYSSVLNSVRVAMAERYVGTQRRALTEIAELLGFSAPSGFTRWFRDQFGCSPRGWRVKQKPNAVERPNRGWATVVYPLRDG